MTLFPKRKLAKAQLKDRAEAKRLERAAKAPFPGVGIWLSKKFPTFFKQASGTPMPIQPPTHVHLDEPGDSHDVQWHACDYPMK